MDERVEPARPEQAAAGADRPSPQVLALHTRHPVRKSKAQKAAFRADAAALLEAAGWPVRVESSGGLVKSHNLVAGEPATAQLILTAHYDTPARLPVPNFIAPRNLPVTLGYQLLLAVAMFVLAFAVTLGVRLLGAPPLAAMLATLAALLALLVLLLAGPANPRNANDNTSGTLAVLQAALDLPPALRGAVALALFDNEELGLVGSAAFRKRYGRLPQKLLLNFDCVGDGDTLLFVQPGACRRDAGLQSALAAAFPAGGGKQAMLDRSPLTLYPSDQMHFTRGVGVVALRRAPVLGLYVSRIHTGRDTVLDEANLTFLSRGICRLAAALAAPPPEQGGSHAQ